jgi:type IV pilus assembly protein PilQ
LANPTLQQSYGAAGASAARGDLQTLQASQAGLQQRQSLGTGQYAADLSGQGFQPGSPGFEARMESQRRLVERQESADARRQIAAAQSQLATGRGAGTAAIDLPFGTDPRMARILAQSILWADDANRILYIKDTPERIAQMKKLIYQLDIPIPQVLIESRLVQATHDWSRGVGIVWGGRNDQSGPLPNNRKSFWGLTGGATGTPGTITQGTATPAQPEGTLITPNFMINLPAVATTVMGTTLQYGFLAGNYITELDFRLQLGEATGQTKVIARPKVQVLDGQPATIKNGRTIAYQTVSADGTQTQLVPVDLLLTVTPTIFKDGRIRMIIKVTDNDVGGIVNGVSEILTREASTIMIVKDGETAVIGGTIRKTDNQARQGWPGLMNIPGINFLFTNKSRSKAITELLVFVTPTVIRRPPLAS